MTTPRTKAGQELLGYLNGDESGLGLIGTHSDDAIAAIEDEMEQRVKAALRDELYRQRNELPFGYVNGLGVAIDAIERVKV